MKWPNRGRDRPTQQREKVPSYPNGSGQALPELDVTDCNDSAENQVQAVAAQHGG